MQLAADHTGAKSQAVQAASATLYRYLQLVLVCLLLLFQTHITHRSFHLTFLIISKVGMKVYTRTGDAGRTSLFNGVRVPKHHILVDAYGTVDECNAAIGMATSHLSASPTSNASDCALLVTRLQAIQSYLFDLGAYLATPRLSSSPSKLSRTQFSPTASSELESWIDDMETKLSPITSFLLPGGHPSAAALHLARTIARRAERNITPLYTAENSCQIEKPAYHFINRLSDFLFVASRFANFITQTEDVLWKPKSPAAKTPVKKEEKAEAKQEANEETKVEAAKVEGKDNSKKEVKDKDTVAEAKGNGEDGSGNDIGEEKAVVEVLSVERIEQKKTNKAEKKENCE